MISKNKIKLLYVHNADFDAVAANKVQVTNMCNALGKIDVSTTLLGFGNTKQYYKLYNIKKDFNIKFFKSCHNYYLRTLKLFNFFRKNNQKYNCIFTRDLFFAYLVKTFYKNKKVIYELHDFDKSKIWLKLFEKTFKKIDHLVVISEGLKRDLNKKGFKNKITILHDGVDIDKFDLKLSVKVAKTKIKLPQNKKVIMYVGSFQDWKGYKLLLDISKELPKDVLIVMVGGTSNQIKALKNKYPRVVFTGQVHNDKIPIYLKSANLLILPNTGKKKISTKYTSPLKLFEYMASKRAIIASDLESIRNIVSDKEVIFFKSDSKEDFKKKIKYCLNNDKILKSYIKNAFQKVKEFTWIKRAEKIKRIFNK